MMNNDNQTLSEYGVQDGHTIHMVAKKEPGARANVGQPTSTPSNTNVNTPPQNTPSTQSNPVNTPPQNTTPSTQPNPYGNPNPNPFPNLNTQPNPNPGNQFNVGNFANLMGMFGGMGGNQGGNNPLGGNPLGGNPLGGNPLGGNPLGGNPLGGIDANNLANMFSNPQIQQQVQLMFQNPQMLQMMFGNNPQLQGILNNPEVMQMLQNPQFMQMLSNPQVIQQVLGMQNLFGGNNLNNLMGMFGGMGGNQGGNNPGGNPQANPFNAFSFGDMFGGFDVDDDGYENFPVDQMFNQPQSTGGNQPNVNFEERYAVQLNQLNDMGFTNRE
jgi:ubiquilin